MTRVNDEIIRGRLGGARYSWPLVGDEGAKVYQKHAIKLLDPVTTVTGAALPAGTCATILSSGNYGMRRAACLSLWGSGQQVHVYTE